MKTVKEILEEDVNLGLTIFDIDETLFHTFAMIGVMKNGVEVKKLTNQELNDYKLKAGESFDFSDFKDAKKFYNTSVPMETMLNRVRAVLRTSGERNKTIFLTAREDFDNKKLFLQTFRKFGINIDKAYVERAGNLGGPSAAQNKLVIIRQYLNKTNYTRVRMFDDSQTNLQAFLSLRAEYPSTMFSAYRVDERGNISLVS